MYDSLYDVSIESICIEEISIFYCYLLMIQCYSQTQKRDYNHCYINYTDIVIMGNISKFRQNSCNRMQIGQKCRKC